MYIFDSDNVFQLATNANRNGSTNAIASSGNGSNSD